jgi:signal transduction histidine kinase
MKLNHFSCIAIIIIILSSCTSGDSKLTHPIVDNTFEISDMTGQLAPKDIYRQYEIGNYQLADINPGMVRYDTWYVIDTKHIDLEGFNFLELARPRTYIVEIYLINDSKIVPVNFIKESHRNIISISNLRAEELIVFKIESLTRQVTLHFNLFEDLSQLIHTQDLNLLYTLLILFLSSLLLLYSSYQSVIFYRRFFIFFTLMQLGYILFLLYDSGYGRFWFGQEISIWMGRSSILLYLALVLPFIYGHYRPRDSHAIKWLLLSSIGIILLIVLLMLTIPITFENSSLFLKITRIFRLSLPLILFYFYKQWFQSKRDFIFTFIMFYISVVPIIKSIQNAGIAEGLFFEHSYSASMIVQSIFWFIYFGISWKEMNQQKLSLIRKQQQLEDGYNQQLIRGQEQERQIINHHIQEELAPAIQTLQLLIKQDEKRSKEELDKIVEDIRYLSRMYISADLDKQSLETEILRFTGLIKTIKPIDIVLEYNLENESSIDHFLLVNIYRLVQEGITNSIVNGDPDLIIVQILGDDQHLVINIEDNSNLNLQEEIQEDEGMKSLRARFSDYNYQMRINHRQKEGKALEIELLNLRSA